jgi:hypothetical protein
VSGVGIARTHHIGTYRAGVTRRHLLKLAGASAATLAAGGQLSSALADPQSDNAPWLTNPADTKLIGADNLPIVGLPPSTRMRVVRSLGDGSIEVWVPRFGLYGAVQPPSVVPTPAPSQSDLMGEYAIGPNLIGRVGLPGRVSGASNLRSWPTVQGDTLLRTMPHNTPLRVLDSVEGDNGEPWYSVNVLDPTAQQTAANGFVHNSLVRVPRMRDQPTSSDRSDNRGRHFQADLLEPALLTAFEDGSPIWASLALKGTDANRTPLGPHFIQARVENETMTSERVTPPIARNAPGGYYLENVLYTQYFTADGASIHYNYWSNNWGYAGTHGCLGLGLNEAKFAWDWASVGTAVYIFE